MTPWWLDYLAVPAIATGAYLWLILVLRVTGKRTLAKLNAFDFAITVAIGSALATIIIDETVGLFRGALVLAMLALLQFAITKASQWSDFARKSVRARPTLLVRDGMIYEKALHEERLTRDELAQVIRNNGFGRLGDVGAVVLETDGSFSVLGGRFEELDLLYDVRTIGDASDGPLSQHGREESGSGGPRRQTRRKGPKK